MLRRHKSRIIAGGLIAVIVLLSIYFRCSHGSEVALPEPPPEPAPSGPPALRFIGRFDRHDAAGPRFAWSGSAIRARFRGTQVSMKIDDKGTNAFTVVIDKLPPRKLVSNAPGQAQHLLATGLASGEHDVLVFKNTQPSYGEVQFLGFDFAGGELLPPRERTRRIEIVGDSISAGMGVDGPDSKCAPTPETENAFHAYGAIAARALGADVTILAASGRGVARNAGGVPAPTMPVLYKRTLPQYDWSLWDFSAWTPDAVVVELGTNDFYPDDPGEAAFVPAYRALLDSIRASYPRAHLFCISGGMLDGADLARARTYWTTVVKAMNSAGDANVEFVEIAPLDAKKEGMGCEEHPSQRTHRRMAAELVAAMRRSLGW